MLIFCFFFIFCGMHTTLTSLRFTTHIHHSRDSENQPLSFVPFFGYLYFTPIRPRDPVQKAYNASFHRSHCPHYSFFELFVPGN
ncbi:hypothetical protein BO99DRAFT_257887 [Aspergillus violaceofuscus CBS 115571]|uniref:Secreted protein n=2 Tax=Aspergillus TaxID=5052 RepID=A0A2V5HKV8_ASPV1|nr:hypothetical protein BO99DRAFT_257887 [Aspergillus violaceofuscus CBS 115571]